MNHHPHNRKTIGWREWVALPDLGLSWVKAKIDTGARTSALHTFCVDEFTENGIVKVRFGMHPKQKSTELEAFCVANVVDQRLVTDSGGHQEKRYVIGTTVQIGTDLWPIEITLTNRDTMAFRMLLGRTAMHNRFLVQPDASYLTGTPDKARHRRRGTPPPTHTRQQTK